MARDETSLADFLTEQKTSSRRFAIEPVPDSNEVVKVTLLTPGMRMSCDAWVQVPVNSIRSLKKTGNTVTCCNKELQAVELEFSDEKALTYDEAFSLIRDVHTSVTLGLAQAMSHSENGGAITPFMAHPGQSPIGGAPRPMGSYGSCMVDAMLRGPEGKRAFKVWMDTWANICDALYG